MPRATATSLSDWPWAASSRIWDWRGVPRKMPIYVGEGLGSRTELGLGLAAGVWSGLGLGSGVGLGGGLCAGLSLGLCAWLSLAGAEGAAVESVVEPAPLKVKTLPAASIFHPAPSTDIRRGTHTGRSHY